MQHTRRHRELELHLTENNIDVGDILETWLKEKNIKFRNYTIQRKDRAGEKYCRSEGTTETPR